MGAVVADISMSLDGYVTAPVAGIGQGLGVDGEARHRWVFPGNTQDDADLLRETFHATRGTNHGSAHRTAPHSGRDRQSCRATRIYCWCVSISARTWPMIFVAVWWGSSSPPSASATSPAKA